MADFDKKELYHVLIDLHCTLNKFNGKDITSSVDYELCLRQLNEIVERFKVEPPAKKKGKEVKEEDNGTDVKLYVSSNLFKLISRNFVFVLNRLPTKVYDVANGLLNHLVLNSGNELDPIAQLAIIVLIDLNEVFPHSLGSLISFSINQIYKILKKDANISSNLIYLLNSLTKYSSRSDLDEKLQAKILKIVTKNLTSLPVKMNITKDTNDKIDGTSISLKKNYILVLRNLTVLSVNANYEHLLATSASSTGGAKMKPESIMSHQHQFQTTLLISLEKQIIYCLSNYCKDIRIAMVEALAHIFINFIPTGKFDSIEYIVSLYKLPDFNSWNKELTLLIIDDQLVNPKDCSSVEREEILLHEIDRTCLNVGVVESIILYVQLEQFQNSDYLSSNLTRILDMILKKMSPISTVDNHIQNSSWIKVLNHWQRVVEYLVKESGPNCHEILVTYLFEKFGNQNSEVEQQLTSTKDKRSSVLFSLNPGKGSSKNKPTNEINVYHNAYQCALILSIIDQLLPFAIDFNTYFNKDEKSAKEEGDDVEIDESKKLEAPRRSQIVELLLTLVINKSDYTRNHSLNTLLKYAKINEVEVNDLVLSCFKSFNSELQMLTEGKKTEVTSNSETNTNSLISVRLMYYSLLLSSLLKQTQSIYLQNSTIVKVLSFCTQTLKHNTTYSRSNNLKNMTCWVILSSLVTLYNESEFVKLNSSQFLIFWKSLLTSQYVPSSMSGATEDGQEKELLDNLKLRNLSLVCLLNYINTVDLTPESLKQIQFLLTKAFNYITYLESNVEVIGDVTNFNGSNFDRESFNYNVGGNILFSNFGYNDDLLLKDSMISSILYSKKIVLRNFTKLVPYLKNDVNSSMIVLLIKIFSSPDIFVPENKEKSKPSKAKVNYNKVNDLDPNDILLSGDNFYHFGVTSKFTDFNSSIDELTSIHSSESKELSRSGLSYTDPFESQPLFKGIIENNGIKEQSPTPIAWFDCIEKTIYESSLHSINYDSLVLIGDKYSYFNEFSTDLITSLVDVAIELFQLVFPFLTLKIQSSLLEQLRSSLTTKNMNSLRYKAITVNISIALHGALNYAANKKFSFDQDIINVCIDILKKIDINSPNIIAINADSIGLASSLIQNKKAVSDQIDSYVSSIVNDSNPLLRGKAILAMAKIYTYTGIGSNDIYNVVSQLLNDPNPVVFHYALFATALLLDNNLTNTTWVSPLLSQLFNSYLNDSFSYDIEDVDFVNLKYKFGSIGTIARILKIITTNLGPNLRSLPEENRNEMKSLIVSLSYTIGSSSIDDNILIFNELLRLLQELIIFDTSLIPDLVEFYTNILVTVISKNLKVGLSTVSATSLNYDGIFPFNSSFELYKLGYGCLTELVKVYGNDILTKDVVQLIWVSLNIKPCLELKKLIELWMESNLEMNWFATLNSLFKISSKKLIHPYIEVNFLQKLLPLLQRQKKKSDQTIDFKDEEIESIVNDNGESDDKNEPITWEFKLFIYDLLNTLLVLANKNPSLLEKLKHRISDLVKIAFLGSTSPINIIKLRGMSLLDKVLGLFGDMEDSMYTGISILEQQQAQIISAIIPCFNSGSTSEVIVNAVNVSSKFINLPRIKFYSKQRILKTLIFFLEELSSNKFIRFGFLENMSEYSKKSIQVAILNCWALVRLTTAEDLKNGRFRQNEGDNSLDDDDNDDDSEPENELMETLNKYSTLLIALWIVSLKEFSTLKYSQSNPKELEIYQNYWVNFVSVLSLELEENNSFVDEYLGGDASTFFFILFSQCVESLIKNKNINEVLVSLNSLVKNKELVDILFHDDIFGEVVDLFDRLILVDDETEIQIKLIEIVYLLFQTYFESHKDLVEGFDKLFELIRLCMLPLFNNLPFLKSTYDPNDKQTQLVLKKVESAPNLVIVKTVFNKLVDMMPRFPDVVKLDLYACLLFIISKIYEFKNELLISAILPYLKPIVQESKRLKKDLITDFNHIIEQKYPMSESNSSVLTYMILLTSGNIQLNESNSIFMKDSLIRMVSHSETNSMGLQCIMSLIQASKEEGNLLILKLLIKDIIKGVLESSIEGKVGIEILMLYVKSQTQTETTTKFYTILIPLILNCNAKINQYYLHEKLLMLISFNAESFKSVVNNNLEAEQRQLTEHLVKLNVDNADVSIADESEIQLKTFG